MNEGKMRRGTGMKSRGKTRGMMKENRDKERKCIILKRKGTRKKARGEGGWMET